MIRAIGISIGEKISHIFSIILADACRILILLVILLVKLVVISFNQVKRIVYGDFWT